MEKLHLEKLCHTTPAKSTPYLRARQTLSYGEKMREFKVMAAHRLPTKTASGSRDMMPALSTVYTLGDTVADLFINVAPVLKRTLQHRIGHACLEMPDDVGHQTAARRLVHDFP